MATGHLLSSPNFDIYHNTHTAFCPTVSYLYVTANYIMAPLTLDLLFLTFNCAKTLIDTAVFSNHLGNAFGQNATELPDLVVLYVQ